MDQSCDETLSEALGLTAEPAAPMYMRSHIVRRHMFPSVSTSGTVRSSDECESLHSDTPVEHQGAVDCTFGQCSDYLGEPPKLIRLPEPPFPICHRSQSLSRSASRDQDHLSMCCPDRPSLGAAISQFPTQVTSNTSLCRGFATPSPVRIPGSLETSGMPTIREQRACETRKRKPRLASSAASIRMDYGKRDRDGTPKY